MATLPPDLLNDTIPAPTLCLKRRPLAAATKYALSRKDFMVPAMPA